MASVISCCLCCGVASPLVWRQSFLVVCVVVLPLLSYGVGHFLLSVLWCCLSSRMASVISCLCCGLPLLSYGVSHFLLSVLWCCLSSRMVSVISCCLCCGVASPLVWRQSFLVVCVVVLPLLSYGVSHFLLSVLWCCLSSRMASVTSCLCCGVASPLVWRQSFLVCVVVLPLLSYGVSHFLLSVLWCCLSSRMASVISCCLCCGVASPLVWRQSFLVVCVVVLPLLSYGVSHFLLSVLWCCLSSRMASVISCCLCCGVASPLVWRQSFLVVCVVVLPLLSYGISHFLLSVLWCCLSSRMASVISCCLCCGVASPLVWRQSFFVVCVVVLPLLSYGVSHFLLSVLWCCLSSRMASVISCLCCGVASPLVWRQSFLVVCVVVLPLLSYGVSHFLLSVLWCCLSSRMASVISCCLCCGVASPLVWRRSFLVVCVVVLPLLSYGVSHFLLSVLWCCLSSRMASVISCCLCCGVASPLVWRQSLLVVCVVVLPLLSYGVSHFLLSVLWCCLSSRMASVISCCLCCGVASPLVWRQSFLVVCVVVLPLLSYGVSHFLLSVLWCCLSSRMASVTSCLCCGVASSRMASVTSCCLCCGVASPLVWRQSLLVVCVVVLPLSYGVSHFLLSVLWCCLSSRMASVISCCLCCGVASPLVWRQSFLVVCVVVLPLLSYGVSHFLLSVLWCCLSSRMASVTSCCLCCGVASPLVWRQSFLVVCVVVLPLLSYGVSHFFLSVLWCCLSSRTASVTSCCLCCGVAS
ncbi:uncharacterized protein LOC121840457 [Oncorhynchus tshawytscha]|uniref:uncharacterized protein LOC121840457 n=1 Tax=Oncorhynchus tshawytscha TaxID=74940 RepID=UPI001C3C64AB|nr:uncharacterized protein LOC121840457 [Oncorhynchus tshawytscha]